MRKLFAAMGAALMLAVPAAANPPTDPANIGSHPALYGLCTAYFSGQGGEHGKKNDAPPFAALEAAAAADPDGDGDATVEDFCTGVRPSNGRGGGSGKSNAPDPVTGRG